MGIVLRVTGYKRDSFIFAGEQVGISIFGFCEDLKVGIVPNQRRREVGIA